MLRVCLALTPGAKLAADEDTNCRLHGGLIAAALWLQEPPADEPIDLRFVEMNSGQSADISRPGMTDCLGCLSLSGKAG